MLHLMTTEKINENEKHCYPKNTHTWVKSSTFSIKNYKLHFRQNITFYISNTNFRKLHYNITPYNIHHPTWGYDHKIHLQDKVQPMNIRPYRHSLAQKTCWKKWWQECQGKVLLNPNHSPFSSPIVLPKKKYNSWRMCIDYRSWINRP